MVKAVGVCIHCPLGKDLGRVATAFEGERSGGGKLDGCFLVDTMILATVLELSLCTSRTKPGVEEGV